MKRFRLQPLLDDFERALLLHRVALKMAIAERDAAWASVQNLRRSMTCWQQRLLPPTTEPQHDIANAEMIEAALQEKYRLFKRLRAHCHERENACDAAFRRATRLRRLKARRLSA